MDTAVDNVELTFIFANFFVVFGDTRGSLCMNQMLNQFKNPANAKIHRETTGPEIWRDTAGQIDVLVSGVGTGGTLSGTSQYIKGAAGCEFKKAIKTVAVEPQEQMLITAKLGGEKKGPQGPHKIQGIGAGIIPDVLDLDMIDEVVAVHSDDASVMAIKLWLIGLPVGVSAGAIVDAAVKVCRRPESAGKLVVAIIPSFGTLFSPHNYNSYIYIYIYIATRMFISILPDFFSFHKFCQLSSRPTGERYFTHPMFAQIKKDAEEMKKQPLPEPFDNTLYGFATPRG